MTKLESEALQAMRKWAAADALRERYRVVWESGGSGSAYGDFSQAHVDYMDTHRTMLAAARKL